jgi:hypothetical protein
MTGNLQDNINLRRALFAAATLAPMIMVYGLIVAPLQDHFANLDREIARQTAILARLKAIAAYQPSRGGRLLRRVSKANI